MALTKLTGLFFNDLIKNKAHPTKISMKVDLVLIILRYSDIPLRQNANL